MINRILNILCSNYTDWKRVDYMYTSVNILNIILTWLLKN